MPNKRMWLNEANDYIKKQVAPLFNDSPKQIICTLLSKKQSSALGLSRDCAQVTIMQNDETWSFFQAQHGGADTDTVTLIQYPKSNDASDWFDWPSEMGDISLIEDPLPDYQGLSWHKAEINDSPQNINLEEPIKNIIFKDDAVIISAPSTIIIARATIGPDYYPTNPTLFVYSLKN